MESPQEMTAQRELEQTMKAIYFRGSFFRHIDASNSITRDTTAACETTLNKSRIFETIATMERRDCMTAATIGGICDKVASKGYRDCPTKGKTMRDSCKPAKSL